MGIKGSGKQVAAFSATGNDAVCHSAVVNEGLKLRNRLPLAGLAVLYTPAGPRK